MNHGPYMTRKTAVIHDFRRDWQRWTRAERVLAAVIAAILLIGVPTAIAMTA
jgi:hypothetical protein